MVQTKLNDIKRNNGSKIIAEELALKQREISISEFFTKNRHLLGFDNSRKALLTTVKEAVDNSLDACEEARIVPEIFVSIEDLGKSRFRVIVEDNGPGVVKEQIPKIFAKLLYGSKFHRMKQGRGQQGIGISASVMYGQLTTGKPTKIISKISTRKPAYYYELHIDTKTNEPEIVKEEQIEWDKKQGTKIDIELEGSYQKGRQSVEEYLKETAIVNPHLQLKYVSPEKEIIEFPKVTNQLPTEPKEIKPHPYGVELGALMSMLKDSKVKNLRLFLMNDFSRVSSGVANKICEIAKLDINVKPKELSREDADKLFHAIKEVKIMNPPTNCLSPIGEKLVEKGLKKEIDADFYASITRPPAVYRGMPFQIECGIAYGGNLQVDGPARIMRFANRVPLLYQQSACASTKAVINTSWKNYGIGQSRGSLPNGPVVILMHIVSVWVPFTSESKEAVAHYPEIIKEMKLALQECGRNVASFLRKKRKIEHQAKRKGIFEMYINEIVDAVNKISGTSKDKFKKDLMLIAQKQTGG